jgi:hypothetical protein
MLAFASFHQLKADDARSLAVCDALTRRCRYLFIQSEGLDMSHPEATQAVINEAELATAMGLASMRTSRVRLRSSTGDPRKFEGGEHMFIGDSAMLRLSNTPGMVRAHWLQLRLQDSFSLTYGQIVALGGDFYGIPDKPISDGANDLERRTRFSDAYASLETLPDSGAEALSILKTMQTEVNAVAAAIANGLQPSSAYDSLGDSLSRQWALITHGRYLKLALTNWDHFGAHAVAAYTAGHAVALATASQAFTQTDPNKKNEMEMRAYAQNAFADHYLSDLFSAGHVRTPRRELHYASVVSLTGDVLSRYMHDEDCHYGLNVTNLNGISWKMYGDKRLLDSVNDYNLRVVEQAVQASVNEIYTALSTGVVPDGDTYEALNYVPILKQFNEPSSVRNTSPLWIADDHGNCFYRSSLNDLNSYAWSNDWTWATLLATMKATYSPPDPLPGKMAAPASPPMNYEFVSYQATPPDWVQGNSVRYAYSYVDDREVVSGRMIDETPLGPWTYPEGLFSAATGCKLAHIALPPPSHPIAQRRVYRQFINNNSVSGVQIVAVVTGAFNDEVIDLSPSHAMDYIGVETCYVTTLAAASGQVLWGLTNRGGDAPPGIVRYVGDRKWVDMPALPDGESIKFVLPTRTTVYAVGTVLYRFDEPNSRWLAVPGGELAGQLTLACVNDRGDFYGYAAGAIQGIVQGKISAPDQWQSTMTYQPLTALAVGIDNSLFAISNDAASQVMMWTDRNWQFAPAGPQNMKSLSVLDKNTVFASNADGALFTSEGHGPSGLAWKSISDAYGDSVVVSPNAELFLVRNNRPYLYTGEGYYPAHTEA